jgi:hypothetical protein
MSSDFKRLMADIKQEAQDQGSLAVDELNRLREELAQASDVIPRRREIRASHGDHR